MSNCKKKDVEIKKGHNLNTYYTHIYFFVFFTNKKKIVKKIWFFYFYTYDMRNFIILFKYKDMTNSELIKTVQSSFLQEGREQIRTGMEVEVYQIIKEAGKERIQKYKGLVIKTSWKSELEKNITVRRKIWAFWVEKVFPIHSSTVQKIDIIRQFKVRRKSIKFIRDLTGKAARLKEVK